jgi:hypothetical protein
LRHLGVPLWMWSLTGLSSSSWPHRNVDDVSSFSRLSAAVGRLKEELERQRIVWVVGEWAPGAVSINSNRSEITLLR